MPSPLARCPNCKLWFVATNYTFYGAVNVVFEGNTQGCPRCGSPANVLDGTYNFFDSLVEIVNAPETTLNQLEELQSLLRQVEGGSKEPEEAARDIEELNPQFSEIADAIRELANETKRASKTSFNAWLGTILAAISVSLALKQQMDTSPQVQVTQQIVIEQTLDRQNFREELRQMLQRCDEGRQQEAIAKEVGKAISKRFDTHLHQTEGRDE